MTMLTSLYPSTHQLNQSFSQWRKSARSLGPEHRTLAEILSAHGYETFALVGGATVDGRLGFARGFDVFATGSAKIAHVPWARLSAWLGKPRERPFFLFFHTFEAHAPYSSDRFAEEVMPSEQRQSMRQALEEARQSQKDLIPVLRRFLREANLYRSSVTQALYDGGVRTADEFVGRLLDELRGLGQLDRTLFVVTSDHGEEFGDHDPHKIYNTHGHSQYREMVHVPLLLRYPGFAQPGLEVESPVGLVDVAPTLLDLLGLPVPAEMQGQSLASLLRTGGVSRNWVLSEATTGARREVKGLRIRHFSLLASYAIGAGGDRSRIPGERRRALLFDLRDDPREQHDIGDARRALRDRMLAALEQRFLELPVSAAASAVPLDEELEAELRALGYL